MHTLAELADALASPVGGTEVVEAVVRRDHRRDLDAATRDLVVPQRAEPAAPLRGAGRRPASHYPVVPT